MPIANFPNRLISLAVTLIGLNSIAFAANGGADVPNRAASTLIGGAKLESFAEPGGETYFALQLSPQIAQPKRLAHDVVVLFDTSASQAGEYWDVALAALDALLDGLGRDDRVALLAVDLRAIELTPSWVNPQGDEVRKARAELQRRVPLGSTDMGRALESVLASFGDAHPEGRARSAVYIGDGMSTARVIFSDRMRSLMTRFVEARISISSFAVGPRWDAQLLASLAKHTGGMLIIAQDDLNAADALDDGRRAGSFLADAAQATVVWPTALDLPMGWQGVYFRDLPPLRFDRATVLLGTAQENAIKPGEPTRIAARAEVDGRNVELIWNVKPDPPAPEQAYLARLVEAGRRDGGASLPSLGGEGLAELRWMVHLDARNLTKLAGQALATGNLEHAGHLAAEAGRLDPQNAELAVLQKAIDKQRSQTTRFSRKPGRADASAQSDEAAQPRESAAGEATPRSGEAADGALLDQVDRRNRVFEGLLRTEVQNVVNQTRAMMSTDALNAMNLLKLTQDRVARATELPGEIRAQLNDQLEAALRAANRQAVVQAERDLRREQVEAELEARERINRDLFIREQKVDQLMARFNSLMDEERYRDAEAVADIAEELEPSRAGLRTAELHSRMSAYITDMARLRDARHRGFVDMMMAVEVSFVPFDDNVPITYPDPEVWQMLTEKRKKWKAVDLASRSEAETKIYAALLEKTELDFTDQPLQDVIEYLKAKHEIEIQLDSKALADAGVGSDTTVTRNIKGITLRSALKILLGELDLTYVVKDEVMLITTKTEAENMLSTRVYPVGDLVIPVRNPLAGGMGGGMGGMGGRF